MNNENGSEKTRNHVTLEYVHYFRNHLAQVQAHCLGQDVPTALPPSFISPTGYWTSAEKDLFFHALSIYSRLRPDLIADHIKTKSTLDVCIYLELLEHAASTKPIKPSFRKELEGAMEVSGYWIKWEEENARKLIAAEALSNGGSAEVAAQNGLERTSFELDTLREDPESVRAFGAQPEGVMKSLDTRHLMVMEMIFRASEYEEADFGTTFMAAEQPTEPAATGPKHPDASFQSHCHVPSNASSHSTTHDGTQLSKTAFLPVSQITSSSSLAPTPSLHSLSANHYNSIPSELSPASKRRLQKRLYMRKKRAESRGELVDEIPAKMRAGRKGKEAISSNPSKHRKRKREVAADDPANDCDGDAQRTGRKESSYKIRKKLAEAGIDADSLNASDLGLFCLSTLARLMKSCKSGHEARETEIASSISAETIRFFHNIAIEFTTEVMQRAVILREQEKTMKGNIKVWKAMRDDVTAENVRLAAETMAIGRLETHTEYTDDCDIPASQAIENENCEDDDGDGNDGDDDDGSRSEHAIDYYQYGKMHKERPHRHLPLFRECRPVYVNLPGNLQPFVVGQNGAPTGSHSLLPLEMNEEDLRAELQQDALLDEQDRILHREYEQLLWKGIPQVLAIGNRDAHRVTGIDNSKVPTS